MSSPGSAILVVNTEEYSAFDEGEKFEGNFRHEEDYIDTETSQEDNSELFPMDAPPITSKETILAYNMFNHTTSLLHSNTQFGNLVKKSFVSNAFSSKEGNMNKEENKEVVELEQKFKKNLIAEENGKSEILSEHSISPSISSQDSNQNSSSSSPIVSSSGNSIQTAFHKLKPGFKSEPRQEKNEVKTSTKESDSSRISLNDFVSSLRNKEVSLESTFVDTVKWTSSDSQLQPIPIFVKTLSGSLIQLQVSLEDSVQVIIQSLAESSETCFITCYELEIEGNRVDDYTTLGEIPSLQPHTTFSMTRATYDEKSAKIHVKRVRDIISQANSDFSLSNSSLLPYFSKMENSKQRVSEIHGEDKVSDDVLPLMYYLSIYLIISDTSLSSFFPPTRKQLTPCLKYICLSPGWNPPPGNRKLLGDLFYLEIGILEDKLINVTACAEGFFVNETSGHSFNPRISSKYPVCQNLVELLNFVSPIFKKNFSSLLSTRSDEKDPFEIYPVSLPVKSWMGVIKEHIYEANRAEDANLVSQENEGQFRDWNEEFQSSKELSRSSIRDRIIRDHAIVKVNNDFVEAATKGACAVINKLVAPLNPMDPKPIQMYIYNNIFFSFAVDTGDKYEEVEGRYTFTSANNDLKGVMAYNNAQVDGLYTLATAIVDYRGYRVVAQSMIPGIFNPSTTVYSSSDFEKDANFDRILKEAGNKLHIPVHEIIDKNSKKVNICCSAPTKGIVGTDGRRYIIDLCRVTPQDSNFKGNKNIMAILRPELMMILNEATDDKGNKNNVMLNPDVFAWSTLGGAEEQRKRDEELVENAGAFLLEVVIPNMIQEFTSFVCVPVDGQTLTTLMHHRGINMRYLGYIAALTNQFPFVQELCIREMIVRCAKHLLRNILYETETSYLAPSIAHFLNCLFGNHKKRNSNSKNVQKKKKKSKSVNKGKGPVFALTSAILWQNIQSLTRDRFQYELQENSLSNFPPIPVLRNVCQKIGIQIASKEYDFSSEYPFATEDILDLFPVIKHSLPKTSDGHDLLEAGVSCLAQGRLDLAFELLSEALVIFSQVYGPMHQSTAICFSNMAMVLYQSGDPAEAAVYQQKAVIINERVQGPDHHETAQSYGNLALFCHKMGKVKLALNYIQRALYLGFLACGVNHPDNGTSFTNIGMILQDLGEIKASLSYFTKALACNEALVGSDHMLLTAAICHAIAIDYNLLGQYKEALEFEKRNYQILKNTIKDDKDPRIEESNILLKQYTSKAVEIETLKHAKGKK